jgi:hypothetical protein
LAAGLLDSSEVELARSTRLWVPEENLAAKQSSVRSPQFLKRSDKAR